jgi:alkanesulfonate monooxygenase SsuD/methylene tetrahydromethanopterin reductase-like flavin-dependent oxidoreductase (luciferase family)
MRVLLDQCTPAAIRQYLKNHQVRTAREQGWSTLSNGDLLKAAEEAGFEVLLTSDSHLRDQQNLKFSRLAIVVLSTNRWKSVRESVASIVLAVDSAKPGLHWVEIPRPKR